MNNSIHRLIDGVVATLRHEVIPATSGDFARGQAFGVIYMLESLKLRVDWSDAFLAEQRLAAEELHAALAGAAPQIGLGSFPNAADAVDGWVCNAYDRLPQSDADADTAALRAALDAYVHRCLRHEIRTSAKPMFGEMSLGREESQP